MEYPSSIRPNRLQSTLRTHHPRGNFIANLQVDKCTVKWKSSSVAANEEGCYPSAMGCWLSSVMALSLSRGMIIHGHLTSSGIRHTANQTKPTTTVKARDDLSRAGPYIAHLESQYSWAQIRLAAYILGSRPSAQVPRR